MHENRNILGHDNGMVVDDVEEANIGMDISNSKLNWDPPDVGQQLASQVAIHEGPNDRMVGTSPTNYVNMDLVPFVCVFSYLGIFFLIFISMHILSWNVRGADSRDLVE